ncbi:MAG: hypothetical protein ABIS23_04300 [Sphingomicrobium sp.]
MSNAFILAMVAVAISLIVVLIASRSGPRITTIETRRDDDSADDDKPGAN